MLLSRHRCTAHLAHAPLVAAPTPTLALLLHPPALSTVLPASCRSIAGVTPNECCNAQPPTRAAAVGRVQFTERKEQDSGISLQHLYAVIAHVAHDDAPLAVDQNAVGILELPMSTASAANGSHVAAVAVAQHLHSMIVRVSYDDVACVVKRDAAGLVELTSA